jgi:glucose/arabinose dehydrogenase
VWHDDGTTSTVPGGQTTDLAAWMKLPGGFCAHPFANVGNARQVRFAPGGELFVASPTGYTTGGGQGGLASIVVLPDDDRDGYADAVIHFMDGKPNTQGLLFYGSWFYYQDDTRILRIPYQAGDRTPQGTPEQLANISVYHSSIHWPKVIDADEQGNIFVGNGGDQGEGCDPSRPFHGGVVKLDGTPNGHPYVRGLRNPIGLRCQHGTGTNLCFAVELARDYSWTMGGREKLMAIHDGDDWGYPCCASHNVPFSDVLPVPDCSATTDESNGFLIGHTPFGVDFEIGRWPPPWNNRAYVVLHGEAGSWHGARMIAIPLDGNGMPIRWSELTSDGGVGQYDFATGWDDGMFHHGRPSALTFAPDGRLFLANDNDGSVIWIAPVVMPPPSDAGADADADADASD